MEWRSTQLEGQQHVPSAYCTQKRLLICNRGIHWIICALVIALTVVALHQIIRHYLNIASLHQLLQGQLSQDIGKGTVEAFVPNLRHEGQIYELLRKAQVVGHAGLSREYWFDKNVLPGCRSSDHSHASHVLEEPLFAW
jgi:hypothetical protein